MDKLTQWVALTVAGCVAVLAAGWFLLVSPRSAEADELREAATAQQAQADALRTQLQVLEGQRAQVPAKRGEIARLRVLIPAEPALPELLRRLQDAGTRSGTTLVTVAPQAAQPVGAAGTTAASPADATAGGSAAAPGLHAVPVSITAVGGYFALQQFVTALEELPRALRVTGVNLAPGSDPGRAAGGAGAGPLSEERTLSVTLAAEVYLERPAGAGAPAGAAVAAAAPGAPAAAAPAAAPGRAAAPSDAGFE